jgi:hypothetical protein
MLSLFGRTERPSRAYGNLDWCAYLEEAAPMLAVSSSRCSVALFKALQPNGDAVHSDETAR